MEEVSALASNDFPVPVVIAKTKCDLSSYENSDRKMIADLQHLFPNIVSSIETSSFDLKNIVNLIYSLQMAACEPSFYIYDAAKLDLTDKMHEVVKNIFKVVLILLFY